MIYLNRKVDGEWKSMYLAEVNDFTMLNGIPQEKCMEMFHGVPVERFEYGGSYTAIAEWCMAHNKLGASMREKYFEYKKAMKEQGEKEGRKLYIQTLNGSSWQYVDQDWVDSVMSMAARKADTREFTALTEFQDLLSTGKLLRRVAPGAYYDGPEFKFLSNRHPSPAQRFIPVLASRYMMNVIIPNSLLAREYGFIVGKETAMRALDYCMRTGKKPGAVGFWEEYVASGRNSAQYRLFSFYVDGIKADGTEVPREKRCFFKKFVDLKLKDAKPRRKSRNCSKVEELLERMKKEPELRAMSHRQLMASGISDRAARLFMKAREEA